MRFLPFKTYFSLIESALSEYFFLLKPSPLEKVSAKLTDEGKRVDEVKRYVQTYRSVPFLFIIIISAAAAAPVSKTVIAEDAV